MKEEMLVLFKIKYIDTGNCRVKALSGGYDNGDFKIFQVL